MNEPEEEKAPQPSKRSKASRSPQAAKAAPWVADPAALGVVGKAAEAVGLTVEELANLVVDAGITALPPSDGITTKYTLKDLGMRLWGTMQENPRHMRAKWFHGLAPTQQAAVIVVMRDRGFSTQVIAEEFKIPMMEVMNTWNRHASNLGAHVLGLRLDTIAGNLQLMAERAQNGAMERGDHSTLWRIQKELTKMFQEIGIVDRAAHQVEVTHKFDERKQAELDSLMELERKKAISTENIKKIEATVVEGDEIPKEFRDAEED